MGKPSEQEHEDHFLGKEGGSKGGGEKLVLMDKREHVWRSNGEKSWQQCKAIFLLDNSEATKTNSFS